ncbi:MAG: RdgB/HAM1 family non-canonical purine NTP pyrophosphatase [Clostridia bacterium]|nr:RdgB/HAM1 family non-canonical purine NTP pyrophosphatase [Clostridia bacterium]
MEKKFVIATNNPHKVVEFKKILAPLGIECVSLKEMGIVCDAEETGTTFAENAYIKAKAVYDICKLPTVADDSGICVDALGGEPGVYSARYGGEGYDDEGRMYLLLKNMEQQENRAAHFTSSISCVLNDETVLNAEGYIFGRLTREPRGTNGFGYDPIFLPDGYSMTTAEMEGEAKNAISHRGNALREFVLKLKEYYHAYSDQ